MELLIAPIKCNACEQDFSIIGLMPYLGACGRNLCLECALQCKEEQRCPFCAGDCWQQPLLNVDMTELIIKAALAAVEAEMQRQEMEERISLLEAILEDEQRRNAGTPESDEHAETEDEDIEDDAN